MQSNPVNQQPINNNPEINLNNPGPSQMPVPQHSKEPGKIKKYILMLRSKLAKLSPKQKIMLFLSSLLVFSLLALASIYTFILQFNVNHENIDTGFILLETHIPSDIALSSIVPEPPPLATEESPLNGKLLTKEDFEKISQTRPIAVMFDNHIDAQPVSNLDQADIVYESLVESGITRSMAIYWTNTPNEVGPIRSVRTYFLDWFSEFDGILYHIGQAYYTEDEEVIVPEADALIYMSMHSIRHSSSGFWRDEDRIKKGIPSEHAAYYSLEEFRSTSLVKNWEGEPTIEPLKFKTDALLADRALTSDASISFSKLNQELYSVHWVYDKATNKYKREQGGKKVIDKISGNQFSAKTLIIEEMEMIPTDDIKGRILFTTIGSGKAYILQDGEVIEGTWEKSSRTSRTKYFDDKGQEVIFNRGLMWITVVPKNEDGELIGTISVN